NEDATGNTGQLISTLLGSSVTDVDSGATQPGIAVTDLASTGANKWQYSTDGGAHWTDIGTVSDSRALLLSPTDRIRLLPDTIHQSTGSFTYGAWDQTSGTHGNKVDVRGNGGTSAFSSATDTANITVTPLNDAPVINTAMRVVTQNEDDGVPSGAVG